MLSEESFYGGVSLAQRRIENMIRKKSCPKIIELPSFLTTLLGPSRTWKIFNKQDKALQFVSSSKNGLMPFAFEQSNGCRLFLVCHPLILWFVQGQRPSTERCTYEIIRESAPCKLYLDIEFEYAYNQDKYFAAGEKMVKKFLNILLLFVKETFSVNFNDQKNILDLDSSTTEKFSRHIILHHPHLVFIDNATVGRIVKDVCRKVTACLETEDTEVYGISSKELRGLQISDSKGCQKLFVDLSVYSKNRHFRILGSSKRNKNAALSLSSETKLRLQNESSHSIFLCSLITYLDGEGSKRIEYGHSESISTPEHFRTQRQPFKSLGHSPLSLDGFINKLISPNGRIRQRYSLPNCIQYDIAGYRFCANIGREHKSNNISYIVDISTMMMYQTCYDSECKRFKSPPIALPADVILSTEDDDIINQVADNLLTDQDLMNLLTEDSILPNADDFTSVFNFQQDIVTPTEACNEFPDMDISDEVMLDIANISDVVLQMEEFKK